MTKLPPPRIPVTYVPTTPPATVPKKALYKDGNYTGSVADAYYGNIQVSAVISGGKLTNVNLLQSPNDRGTSIAIAKQYTPILVAEAIKTQSANVHIVSGATQNSQAFRESLASALDQAKI